MIARCKFAVKASVDDQFAILAASIFAGRNWSAVPFGSVGDLLDSLGDLTLSRNRATVATRFGSRTTRGGTATGSARSCNVSPESGSGGKVRISNA